MSRQLLVLTLAAAFAAPALAQQPAYKVAGATPAELDAWRALLSAVPAAAETPAPAAMTARELTSARFRSLRALVPASEISLARQLSAGLRSRDGAERSEALQDVILYASQYGDLIDLSGLAPALLRVFASDAEPGRRVMASQALCYLADVETVREMARLAQRDPSPRVRHLALYAAAARLNADRTR